MNFANYSKIWIGKPKTLYPSDAKLAVSIDVLLQRVVGEALDAPMQDFGGFGVKNGTVLSKVASVSALSSKYPLGKSSIKSTMTSF